VFTDEHRSYTGLGLAYEHAAVSHSAGEYVRWPVHTNSVESLWYMFKRYVLRHLPQNEPQTPNQIRKRIRRSEKPQTKTHLGTNAPPVPTVHRQMTHLPTTNLLNPENTRPKNPYKPLSPDTKPTTQPK